MFEFFSWAAKKTRGRTAAPEANEEFGIEVEPTPITAGDTVTVKYNGLLAKNGARQIYLHAGYGDNQAWEEVRDVPMRKVGANTWMAELPVGTNTRLNFCFRDDADHWDNNNGLNWSYEVHNGILT